MSIRKTSIGRTLIGLAALGAFGSAGATTIDLTGGYAICSSVSGTPGAAEVCGPNDKDGSTGSGVFPSFVGTSGGQDPTFFMYNTTNKTADGNQVGNGVPKNRDAVLSDFAVVNRAGVDVFTFVLDINQFTTGNLLSVDSIRIYLSSDGSLTGFDSGTGKLGGVSPVWAMSSADWIKLDYNLTAGSGRGDMFLYVPVSYFGGAAATTHVQFYSFFGTNNGNNDGFEEWSYLSCTQTAGATCYTPPEQDVPEPATLALLGAGLAGFGFARRRRKS